ncbi:MAG: cytidine deaminase [Gemmataceae bacterium]
MSLIDRARRAAPPGGLHLPPAAAADLARAAGSLDALLLALIPLARSLSVPKLSGFQVGAVALGTAGAVYFGANLEPDSASLAATVHAEQSAVVNAILHGEPGVERLAVSSPPCGYCRQFLYELTSADRLQIILADRPPTPFLSLLPGPFGPRDLGLEGALPPAKPAELAWINAGAGPAAEAALAAARRSYAPYTGALAGLGLVIRRPDGTTATFGGPYLENVAFNPSLSPVQTVLIALAVAETPAAIMEATLVQLHDSKLNHATATVELLSRLAPGVKLKVYTVRRA